MNETPEQQPDESLALEPEVDKKSTPVTSLQEEKIKELTETVQRLQAEFENYRKRQEKQQQEYAKFATKEFITELLPIFDHFTLALKHTKNQEEFVKGIELIYAQCKELLEQYGVVPLDTVGKKFNPLEHEALMQEISDKSSGTVIEEFSPGYKMNDAILRTAKVKIAQ